MNIWKWILFYIYSGIAFGALLQGRRAYLAPISDTESPSEELRNHLLERITNAAMQAGNLMADATTTAIVAGYNHDLIQSYESAQRHNAAVLKAAESADKQGA